jgi:hypothetical protein
VSWDCPSGQHYTTVGRISRPTCGPHGTESGFLGSSGRGSTRAGQGYETPACSSRAPGDHVSVWNLLYGALNRPRTELEGGAIRVDLRPARRERVADRRSRQAALYPLHPADLGFDVGQGVTSAKEGRGLLFRDGSGREAAQSVRSKDNGRSSLRGGLTRPLGLTKGPLR